MDIVFTGRQGVTPDEESPEYAVLAACSTRRAWPAVRDMTDREFVQAIERLRALGWGFVWTWVH